jgi:hypothetical protein
MIQASSFVPDKHFSFAISTAKHYYKQQEKKESLTGKMKRSPDERYTQTHRSLNEMFK